MEMATVTNIVNSGPRPFDQDDGKPPKKASKLGVALAAVFVLWTLAVMVSMLIVLVSLAQASLR